MPADSTIGDLAAASTLAGTEVLPVEQGGATVKATVDQIVAAGDGTYVPVAGTYAATTTDALTVKVTGDANERFILNADGTMTWGAGSGAVDTDLFRDALSTLRTSGNFYAGNGIVAKVGAAQQVAIGSDGTNGAVLFGSASDVILARPDASTLTLNKSFKLTASAGRLIFGHADQEQTTVGAAGAASAVPATPTKYIKVVDSAGTTLVIPAFAAS